MPTCPPQGEPEGELCCVFAITEPCSQLIGTAMMAMIPGMLPQDARTYFEELLMYTKICEQYGTTGKGTS
jgi:hypothetical protein